MITYDFTPLFRSAIGFDSLARQIERAARLDDPSAYPPCDVESDGGNGYRITLAVAGFSQGDLSIEVKESVLTVVGRKIAKPGEGNFLHRGISNREFVRRFQLAEHVLVTGANLSDGLLTIDLVREVPEEKKPRSIPIRGEAPEGLLGKAKSLLQSAVGKDAA